MKQVGPVVLFVLIVSCGEWAFAQQPRGIRSPALSARARLYEGLIASSARRHNVDPHLLWTIAYLESRFRNDVVSYKNGKPCAYGMMQFTVPTALRYGLVNPHDPKQSIDAAARYVRDLQVRFRGRADLILAAYNAGEGTVEAFRDGRTLELPNKKIINPHGLRTGGIPPYQETRNYVAKGEFIHRKIIADAIFNLATSVKNSPQKNQQNNRLARTRRQDSIYAGRAATEHRVQPTKASSVSSLANSIYVN
jgi:Transglycosylase SLT domain